MSCCSGPTQTRNIVAIATFRPNNSEQFQLRIELAGRNGLWTGRASRNFDFGNEIGCGNRPPIGEQEVSMRMELRCTEGGPNLVVNGYIDIRVAKTTNRFHLPPAVLDCPRGGPGCVAEWPLLFYNQYLGSGTLTARGVINRGAQN